MIVSLGQIGQSNPHLALRVLLSLRERIEVRASGQLTNTTAFVKSF
jgi:hypothetical protein